MTITADELYNTNHLCALWAVRRWTRDQPDLLDFELHACTSMPTELGSRPLCSVK